MTEERKKKLRKAGRTPETVQAPPEGEIAVVREISFEEKKTGCFSFEKRVMKAELVIADVKAFVRVMDYDCSSGANGRPCSSIVSLYFPVEEQHCEALSAENWQALAGEVPAYRTLEYSNDVLF